MTQLTRLLWAILGFLMFASLLPGGKHELHYSGDSFSSYFIWVGIMYLLGLLFVVYRYDLQRREWKPKSDSQVWGFYRVWIEPDPIMDFLLYFYCGFVGSAFLDVLFYLIHRGS